MDSVVTRDPLTSEPPPFTSQSEELPFVSEPPLTVYIKGDFDESGDSGNPDIRGNAGDSSDLRPPYMTVPLYTTVHSILYIRFPSLKGNPGDSDVKRETEIRCNTIDSGVRRNAVEDSDLRGQGHIHKCFDF